MNSREEREAVGETLDTAAHERLLSMEQAIRDMAVHVSRLSGHLLAVQSGLLGCLAVAGLDDRLRDEVLRHLDVCAPTQTSDDEEFNAGFVSSAHFIECVLANQADAASTQPIAH